MRNSLRAPLYDSVPLTDAELAQMDAYDNIPDEEICTGIQILVDADGIEHAKSLSTGNFLY